MECFICNNNITNDKITLKCEHSLHYDCMIQFLRLTYYGADSARIVCPICHDKTVMHEIPAPDIDDKEERFKMLIGDFNECKMHGCSEKEEIGNEGYCASHNQRFTVYSEEAYNLAFYWIYTICKQSIEARKRGFFDVVLKVVEKYSFTDSDQITDHILTSLGDEKYDTDTLYQKTGVIKDTVV